MVDDKEWKRRFHIFVAVRMLGLATARFGLAIAFTDVLREGGWPLVGGIVAIMGLLDAVFAPRLLKKSWEQSDG